jgi:phosphate transport system substrate-binding protein
MSDRYRAVVGIIGESGGCPSLPCTAQRRMTLLKNILLATAVAGAALTSAAVEARTQIRVVGSSTVYPFTTAVAEQFRQRYPQFGAPIVESTGTGGGLKLFCAGIGAAHPDVANASRRIKKSEVDQCKSNGVTNIVEIQVGLDGLAFAQGKSAAPLKLTTIDVYKALAATPYGKPNKARTWKDVNPALPAQKIELIGPPPTSGTRDSFNELVMLAGCNKNPAMAALEKSDKAKHTTVCTKIREDGAFIEGGENDNLIVQKLASNPNAVGAFGYSFLEENLDKVKGIPINGVTPTYDTISSFAYPVARPLYIYAKGQHVRAIRGLREFLVEYSKDSTWGPQGYLAKRGLVAAPQAIRAKNASNATALTALDLASVK